MPWFKVDDQFWSHPKVVELSAEAVSLWVRAGSYSAQHLTDGAVTYGIIRMLAADRDAATELTNAGLWDQRDSRTWTFHDWEDYQPDAIASKDRREKKQEAAALGNHQRWHVGRGVVVDGCAHCASQGSQPDRTDDRKPIARGGIPPSPSPSPSPDSTYVSESQSLDNRARSDEKLSTTEERMAAQFGVQPERVQRKVADQLGIHLPLRSALSVAVHILSKPAEPPRTPMPYVLGAITRSPAEVAQYIHELGLESP